ncbi:MAG: hypothetical protein MUD07_07850 [Burkholderiaceae bacterium]|jgi:hypothetical protein|nr:hypothetical protein [Burkholderiaceae bacterium]
MTTRSIPFEALTLTLPDSEPVRARRRFAAIVRALATLAQSPFARVSAPAQAPRREPEFAGPLRRPNRLRRLLGRIPRPGKSRQHTRRPV